MMNSVTENNQNEADMGESEADDGASVIGMLRRFHYGEPAATANTTKPAGGILPALLNPHRDASAIRYQYPLYLPPPDGTDQAMLAKPAAEHLFDSLEELTLGENDARILKDNLPWIERYIRQKLQDPAPVDALKVFEAAGEAMQEQLKLEQSSRELLATDLGRLKDAIAPGGQFLGYGPHAPLHLMVHAIRHRNELQREAFRQRVNKHIHGLSSLLAVEKAKATETDADGNDAAGAASQYLDTDALSGMLGKRAHGSVDMSAERRARIEGALQVLQAWQDDPVLVKFVGKLDDQSLAALPALEIVTSDNPCTTATEIFTQDAKKFAQLFAAARVAALEIEDK